jgi:hypothetical protein
VPRDAPTLDPGRHPDRGLSFYGFAKDAVTCPGWGKSPGPHLFVRDRTDKQK